MNTAKKLAKCRAVVAREYGRKHSDPWVIAYSGGKDSTLLLQVTWEVLAALPDSARHRQVHVVGKRHVGGVAAGYQAFAGHRWIGLRRLRAEAGLPISTRITRPNIDQTFWVNVIGRGYIPADAQLPMVYRPDEDPAHGAPARGAGQAVRTRRAACRHAEERVGNSGRRNMAKRRVSATTMNAHGSISGCRMFAPLADLDDEDVWKVLMQRPAPWGGTHRDLITLYRKRGRRRVPVGPFEGRCPVLRDDIA